MQINQEQFLSMALSFIEIGIASADAENELKSTSDYQNAVA